MPHGCVISGPHSDFSLIWSLLLPHTSLLLLTAYTESIRPSRPTSHSCSVPPQSLPWFLNLFLLVYFTAFTILCMRQHGIEQREHWTWNLRTCVQICLHHLIDSLWILSSVNLGESLLFLTFSVLSCELVMRVGRKTKGERVTEAPDGAQCWLWHKRLTGASVCPFTSMPQNGSHFWEGRGQRTRYQWYTVKCSHEAILKWGSPHWAEILGSEP